MKRFFAGALAIAAALLLASCNVTNLGSSADAPTDVVVKAGDGSATVTWTMQPGVQYWLFRAAAPSITTDNWSTLPEARATISATSPQLVTGLVNGESYSFTINARVDSGPGGAGSPSLSATPRLAGNAWSVGTPLGGSQLAAVTYGVETDTTTGNIVSHYVAVGAGGAMYSGVMNASLDGITWTALNYAVGTNLNAATFSTTVFLAAGDGGTMLYSTDAATWVPKATGTSNNLYGLATNGSTVFVAVGANGTIITSGDGVTWTARSSGTTQDLTAVTYGNGLFLAVGKHGTVLVSSDAVNWVAEAAQTTANLSSVVYGLVPGTGSAAGTLLPLYVAVGAAGSLITSTDGVTWTLQSPIAANNLAAVSFNTQFVAVGSGGSIFTSTTGTSWQQQVSGTSSNLAAIAHNFVTWGTALTGLGTNLVSVPISIPNATTPASPSGYVVVGAAGTNLAGF
ncbi:MAG TPA: hypothetical protein VMV91_14735 [Rhodocyclaceae bacterium]|nr:hypothetical protein [Rhodocyclaceae bacterium]